MPPRVTVSPAATRKPVATRPSVTSSAAGKQPTSGAGTDSGSNGGTQPDGTNNPDNGATAGNTGPLKPGIEPGNTDQAGQDSTAPAQTEGEAAQTLQASVDSGKLTITGDLVTTGNITEASETMTILKAGDGAVIVTVICGDKQYTAGVSDTVAVANAVLTPEQIQLVGDGETIEIRVDVKDISETVSGQDKEIIESGLAEYRKDMPGLTLGMYVDISLFVKVGEGGWDAVTHTEEPIDVVVGIPEELKGDGREFSIIRSHDGEYTLLPDTDDDPDTITVRTDMFSAYALVYEQVDKAEASAPGESGIKCGLCHICPTFLGICCFIWLVVFVAILLVIGFVIWRKRKEER